MGGLKFYERKEVKDILAYLRAIINLDDELSLRRIINVPKRGIGDKAEDVIDNFARKNKLSYGQAIAQAANISELSANAVDIFWFGTNSSGDTPRCTKSFLW